MKNILARKGLKVVILEKNDHAGGCLQSFPKDGVMFDTGIHYVGGLGEGQVLRKLFTWLGIMDKLHIRQMDPDGFDHFHINGDRYVYPSGYDRFRKQLIEYFPAEEKAIDTYIQKLHEITRSVSLYNLQPTVFDPQIFFDKFSHGNAWEFIQNITNNHCYGLKYKNT